MKSYRFVRLFQFPFTTVTQTSAIKTIASGCPLDADNNAAHAGSIISANKSANCEQSKQPNICPASCVHPASLCVWYASPSVPHPKHKRTTLRDIDARPVAQSRGMVTSYHYANEKLLHTLVKSHRQAVHKLHKPTPHCNSAVASQ